MFYFRKTAVIKHVCVHCFSVRSTLKQYTRIRLTTALPNGLPEIELLYYGALRRNLFVIFIPHQSAIKTIAILFIPENNKNSFETSFILFIQARLQIGTLRTRLQNTPR